MECPTIHWRALLHPRSPCSDILQGELLIKVSDHNPCSAEFYHKHTPRRKGKNEGEKNLPYIIRKLKAIIVNLRHRAGDERRWKTLCDKRDNNFV